MSKTVDTKVVEMQFDNDQFEKNVKTSLTTLEKLQAKLDSFTKGGKGLDDLNKAAKSFTLDDVGASVERLEKRFSAMGIAGMTVISELTKSALNFGKTLVNSVLEPIKTGGWSRASNIANAQFMIEGLNKDWSKVYDAANYAVTGTAYGFDAAAKAAASLAASGVKLDDTLKTVKDDAQGTEVQVSSMHQALRGISGVAAMSNSSYEEISSIFTTVAGQGKLMTMQLRQLESRGLNVAATLGQQLGKSEAEIRDMVQKGKIDFATFSKAMDEAFGDHAKDADRTFQGVTANIRAALARIGQMFYEPIVEQDGPVVKFLQQVKKKLNEVKAALSPLVTAWDKFVRNAANLGTKYLKSLDATSIANTVSNLSFSLVNLGKAITSLVLPAVSAFKQAFAGTALGNLESFSAALKDFTGSLVMNSKRMGYLQAGFKGIFDVLAGVGKLIAGLVKAVVPIFSESDGFLDILLKTFGILGKILSYVVEVISKSGVLQGVLTGISIVSKVLLGILIALGSAIGFVVYKIVELVGYIRSGTLLNMLAAKLESFKAMLAAGIPNALDKIKGCLSDLGGRITTMLQNGGAFGNFLLKIGTTISNFFKKVIDNIKSLFSESIFNGDGAGGIANLIQGFKDLGASIKSSITDDKMTVFDKLVTIMGKLFDAVAKVIGVFTDFIGKLDLGKIAALAFTGIVIAIAYNINKMLKSITEVADGASGLIGILKKLAKGQVLPKPSLLEDIAITIAVVAGSLKLLSTIEPGRLEQVAWALGILMGAIAGFAIAINLFSKHADAQNVAAIGLTIVALGASVALIAIATKVLEDLDFKSAIANVLMVGGLCVAMAYSLRIMSKNTPKIAAGALSILAYGLAVKAILKGLTELQNVNFEDMTGALLTMGVVMTLMAAVGASIGKVGIGAALTVLAIVWAWNKVGTEIKEAINNMDFSKIEATFKKGMEKLKSMGAALAVAVAVLIGFDVLLKSKGGGLESITKGILSLVIAVGALGLIAYALGKLPDEDAWKRGLRAVGILGVIVAAFEGLAYFTKESKMLQFSAALVVMSGAMGIMGGLAYLMGRIPAERMKKGLIAIGVLSGCIALIEAMSYFTGNAKVLPILTVMAGISAIFAELVILTMVDTDTLLQTSAAMSLVLLSVSLLFIEMTKLSEKANFKSLLNILAGIGVISAVGYALQELAGYGWNEILPAMTALSVTMLAFAAAMVIITRTDGRTFGKNKLKGVLTACVMLGAIAGTLRFLAGYSWGELLPAMTSLSVVMIVLGGICALIAKMKLTKDQATGLLIASASLIVVGASLKILAGYGWSDILPAMTAMSVTLLAVGAALAIVAKMDADITTAGTLVVASLALISVAGSLSILAGYDWNAIMPAMVAMSVVLVVLGGVLGILSAFAEGNFLGMAAAAAGLVIASVGIMAIGAAIKFICDSVNPEAIWPAVGAIAALMGVFTLMAALSALFPPLAAGFIIVGAAVTLFGIGVLAAGAGITLFATACQILAAIDMAKIATSFQLLAPALTTLATSCIGLLVSGAAMIIVAAGIAAIGLACNLLGAVTGLPLLASGLTLLQTAANGALGTAGKLLGLAAAIGVLALAVGGMTIAAAGFGIIAAGMNLVGNAAITMANCFQTAVRFIMTAMTELGKLPQMMAKAGADAISGFVSGISKNQNPILKAGMGVATLFLKGISDVGGWHSPWVKTLLAGADAVIGLVTGVESNMAEVYEAGGETADALVDAISSGIAQGAPEIQSALDGALSGLDLNFSFSGFDVNSLFGTVEKGYGGMPSDVARMMNKDKVLDFSSALDTMSGSLDKVGGSAGKTKDSLASLEDTIAGQIDIFSEWSNKEAISADQMLHNMQSQIDGVTNWANNMQALGARGIDQGLLQKLAELGPQGADKVAAFASMTDEQLQQANALWAQSLLLPKSAASQIYSSFSAAGKNMTAGLVAGIDTHAADQPIHETGENANNEFCDVEGIKSPSRVYQQYGEYLIMGLENGIKARQHIPVNLLIMLANNMLNNFKSSIKVSDFYSIGANVTEGLAKGMESNLDKVRTAASKLSEAAKTTTAEDLKVESPSRVFMAIGRYVAEGLAIGIENNTGMVKDAVTSMSDQTIQGFKKATDLINEYVDENLNLCPVIKPTIDVGSLSAQVDRFNKTLDASSVSTAFNASKQSTQQTQNVSELQNGTGTTTGNTTFIQNNYSPKALSRAEIYRQTRNQFAMYKQSMG